MALLLAALDQTIVSTAMPRIVADLGGLNYYSWVFTSYLLTSTAATPIFGKLSDLYGRKPLIVGGMLLFLAASGLCGLAQSMPMLVILRGVQGIGGGVMMVNAFSIVGDLFPPSERGRWQGLTSSTWGFASIVGPTVGGFLTDSLSWRWIFYVNLPIGAAAFVVIAVTMPSIRHGGRRHSIDYLGVAALLSCIVPLLLAFVWAGDLFPWSSPQFAGLLGVAALGAAAFLWVERRAPEPILPLHLFNNRTYTACVVTMFIFGMAMFGAAVYIPLFMIAVLGSSATGAGLATMPLNVAGLLASTGAGLLVSLRGKYRVQVIGAVIVLALGEFLLAAMDTSTSTLTVYVNMVIVGLGMGALMPVLNIVVQNAVPYRFLGTVTSSVQFFRSIGQTIGVAIFGSILASRLAVEIPRQLTPGLSGQLSDSALAMIRNPRTWLSPVLPPELRQELAQQAASGRPLLVEVTAALRGAFAGSLHDVFLISAGLSLLAVLAVLTLREMPLRTSNLEAVLAGQGEGFPSPTSERALALASEDGGG